MRTRIEFVNGYLLYNKCEVAKLGTSAGKHFVALLGSARIFFREVE
jgi:hypothetical protein